MACKTSFELHHNFPKLAEESGFTFNTHKPRVHINWNKIKLIDIENLMRDRKFVLIEQHINDVLDCVLESEFDVRILDEGVVKIFRLAQLAVEYQQFCRHYLDRSVYVLREEVTNLVQDLDATKKSLREKEEENRKLRKKSKHPIRTPLPYGNENIATMILKTLNQGKGEMFASASHLDAIHYNKCNYCEKVFLNQLYLKSHISRRHANILEIPQRDITDGEVANDINVKLSNEVEELKNKLKQMEDLIANKCSPSDKSLNIPQIDSVKNVETKSDNNYRKETKDAEVSTNEGEYILDKIQEWKKEEHEKYNEELSSLRKQIIDIISAKEKQENATVQNELKMMEKLHDTIKEQGREILALKQELSNEESNEIEKRKKTEEQMAFWIKRAETQSNEYKTLLQKLNDVASEAQEFRMQADTEKKHVKQLQDLLQHHLNNTSPKQINNIIKQNVTQDSKLNAKQDKLISKKDLRATNDVINPTADVITLQKLQQKAQELLNIDQTSTSDSSSSSENKINTVPAKKEFKCIDNVKKNKKHERDIAKPKARSSLLSSDKTDFAKNNNTGKKQHSVKSKLVNTTSKKTNGYVYVPGSPLKIVRAKITEEVNHRLISLGVDPLNSRLSQIIFQKQRKLLQEQHELKSKKWPTREKILHSIMCDLNQNTNSSQFSQQNDYFSPNKSRKTFSLASVLSNVKTKALSLVKSNEAINKPNKSYDDVAKKAMALLKTPPDSAHTSPTLSRSNLISSPIKKQQDVLKMKNKKYQPSTINTKSTAETRQENASSNESYSESDEQDNYQQSPKSVKDLVGLPIHKPIDNAVSRSFVKPKKDLFNVNGKKVEAINVTTKPLENKDKISTNDEDESMNDPTSPRKFLSEENLSSMKTTKGVLKNASSTSSLNKKKVLFDMDAIQMKSVSASPSQSITEKTDSNDKYGIGIVTFDTEEWDVSSIENEPVRTTASNKLQNISVHTSPKIAELKQTIESQLMRRNPTLSTALVGGVDVLTAPMQKATNYGGSNTSLGSSILDDTDSVPVLDHKTLLKPRTAFEKDDSEIEISDLIDDRLVNKN